MLDFCAQMSWRTVALAAGSDLEWVPAGFLAYCLSCECYKSMNSTTYLRPASKATTETPGPFGMVSLIVLGAQY